MPAVVVKRFIGGCSGGTEGEEMKVFHLDKTVISATTGNEIRPRQTARVVLMVVYGAWGWYAAHIVGRFGIRIGLGIVPNIIMVFAAAIGGIALLQWLLQWRFTKSPAPDWLIWVLHYEVKRPKSN